MLMAQNDGLHGQYKRNARLTLELSETSASRVAEKRKRELNHIRYKLDLDRRGIDDFSESELKKLLEFDVITRHAYNNQLKKMKEPPSKELKVSDDSPQSGRKHKLNGDSIMLSTGRKQSQLSTARDTGGPFLTAQVPGYFQTSRESHKQSTAMPSLRSTRIV